MARTSFSITNLFVCISFESGISFCLRVNEQTALIAFKETCHPDLSDTLNVRSPLLTRVIRFISNNLRLYQQLAIVTGCPGRDVLNDWQLQSMWWERCVSRVMYKESRRDSRQLFWHRRPTLFRSRKSRPRIVKSDTIFNREKFRANFSKYQSVSWIINYAKDPPSNILW